MFKRLMQAALILTVASCGNSSSTTAQPAGSSASGFGISPIATFDNPWALAFLPGTMTALVTEKPGHVWLIDAKTGRKQPVAGAPRVLYEGQGGLLDVALSPTFASDGLVYLSYSEPAPQGGSGLALARAKLDRTAGGARLDNLQVLWRDPEGGKGGQEGACHGGQPVPVPACVHRLVPHLVIGDRGRRPAGQRRYPTGSSGPGS